MLLEQTIRVLYGYGSSFRKLGIMAMNSSGIEKSAPTLQITSVREAADEMGVSERTIYRMLRSGRLARDNPRVRNGRNVSNVSDNTCQYDIDEMNNSVSQLSKMSNMSDNSTLTSMEMLTASLR